jgi:phosphatidylcholine synthase
MDNRFYITRAWLVHLYTATGLIAAFAAFRALMEGDVRSVFLWQGAALSIDATDGPLARRWEVRRWTPAFDGRKLDDIVDYLNYTFIPVLFAYRFELVLGPWVVVLPLVLIASAYGFCQVASKTDDGYFTGFPNYWNLVVLYIYLLGAPPWASSLTLGVFAVLIFVPVKYMTWKSPLLPRLTLTLSLIWFLLLGALVIWFESLPGWLTWVSLIYPAYHLGVSFYLYLFHHPAKVT